MLTGFRIEYILALLLYTHFFFLKKDDINISQANAQTPWGLKVKDLLCFPSWAKASSPFFWEDWSVAENAADIYSPAPIFQIQRKMTELICVL